MDASRHACTVAPASFSRAPRRLAAASLLDFAAVRRPPSRRPRRRAIRLVHAPFICLAPQYLAEEFLRLEGFTDWELLPVGVRSLGIEALVSGQADISMWDTHSSDPDAGCRQADRRARRRARRLLPAVRE